MPDFIQNIKMSALIVKRAATIILSRCKNPELNTFRYSVDTDTNDTVIVRFNFSNVLWYIFNDKKTFSERHIVVRHGNNSKDVLLTVQGLFIKRHYIIRIKPDDVLLVEIGSNAFKSDNNVDRFDRTAFPHN